MRMRFPKYDYDDMVEAQRRMLSEGLGVTRLRLLMGTSMGCMHGFVWATKHPDFARAIMPLACFPIEIGGHNRMWRRLAVDGIRNDPAWANGDYARQPVQGLRTAVSILQIAGFAPRYLQRQFPTREAADAYIAERVERDITARDANDLIYQLEASRNYDPRPRLHRIRAPILWINSEDDFINPAGNEAVTILHDRLPTVHFVLVPQSPETRGHGTHTWASFWKQWVVELLRRTE
jgi:homoserine O-acetyltransferase